MAQGNSNKADDNSKTMPTWLVLVKALILGLSPALLALVGTIVVEKYNHGVKELTLELKREEAFASHLDRYLSIDKGNYEKQLTVLRFLVKISEGKPIAEWAKEEISRRESENEYAAVDLKEITSKIPEIEKRLGDPKSENKEALEEELKKKRQRERELLEKIAVPTSKCVIDLMKTNPSSREYLTQKGIELHSARNYCKKTGNNTIIEGTEIYCNCD